MIIKNTCRPQPVDVISAIAGGIAHEYNNLLQTIGAYTHFAMEGLDPQDQRYQDLQQVLEASNRAALLTRQLLGFGRKQALDLRELRPHDLIDDFVKILRPALDPGISIDVRVAENAGMVQADREQLLQLLMNLGLNAQDAMPKGGRLFLSIEQVNIDARYADMCPDISPGRYLTITVSDTGIGMPPDVREHIFEPFFTTKGQGQGTGLGLAMAYGIVQQHHGAIRVYSKVGLGTTFKIYLPTQEPTSLQVADTEITKPLSERETILVAEDESVVRELYVRILGKAGYRLLIAADGKQAWDVFQAHENEIDLLVLDVVMPNQGGRELHDQISHVRPDIPVIFCSGYDPDNGSMHFVDDVQHPFIQKPFDPGVLLGTVRHLLEKSTYDR